MKKKMLLSIMLLSLILSLTACGGKKIVHCDNCNAEIEVAANSNITEDWTLYCEKCNQELGIEEAIIESLK